MHPIVVLLYHRFADDDGPDTTRPKLFAEHLRVLRDEGYRPLQPSEFVRAVEQGLDVGRRRYLMTFDDGVAGIEQVIEPMVREGVGAISFLISARIGQAGYIDGALARRLKAQAGFEFASHTHHHERWPLDATSLEAVARDLRSSRERLRDEVGAGPFDAHLAWPWGRCTPSFEAAARAEGYRWQYIVQRCAVSRVGQIDRLPRACMDGVGCGAFRRTVAALASPGSATLARLATGAVRRWRHGLAY